MNIKRLFISASITFLFLSSCSIHSQTIQQTFVTSIGAAESSEINSVLNRNGLYFDYYLPITMGHKLSAESSLILESFQRDILMSLDVVNIVLNEGSSNQSSLRDIFNKSLALVNIESITSDFNGLNLSYKAQLFELEKNLYLVVIQTQNIVVSAQMEIGLVNELAYEMLRLARTVNVDRSLVVTNYSNKETFSYQKVNLNMFAQMAPESGTIIDMIEGEEQNLLDDNYYDVINDSPTEEEILQD